MRTLALHVSGVLLAALVVACGGGSVTGPHATPVNVPARSVAPMRSGFPIPSGLPSGLPVSSPANPGSQPGTSIDACALLSDDDVRAASGGSVVSRKPSTLTQVFRSVCDLELDTTGSLRVSVLSSGGKSLWDDSFEPFIGTESGPLDAAVTGIGDEAGRSEAGDDLMVLKDDTLFDLFYIEFGRNDDFQVVQYLAQTVLAKLPCAATACAGFTPLPLPSTAGAIDACSLLTDDQIKSATGLTASGNEPSGATGHDPSCMWTLKTDSNLSSTDWIEVKIMSTGGRSQFDFLAGAYDPPLEHVPGLGDDALKTATIPGGSFYVIAGDGLITVNFSVPLSVDAPYALVQPLVSDAVAAASGADQ